MKSLASEPGLSAVLVQYWCYRCFLCYFYCCIVVLLFLLLYYKVLDFTKTLLEFEFNMFPSLIIVSFLKERNPLGQKQSLL